MEKIFDIDYAIEKSQENINRLQEKLGLSDLQLNVAYASTTGGCMYNIEPESFVASVVRSVKVRIIQSVLQQLGYDTKEEHEGYADSDDLFDDLEALLISKFRNESYVYAKKNGAVKLYVNYAFFDTEIAGPVLDSDIYIIYAEDEEDDISLVTKINDNLSFFRTEKIKDFNIITDECPDFSENMKNQGFVTYHSIHPL